MQPQDQPYYELSDPRRRRNRSREGAAAGLAAVGLAVLAKLKAILAILANAKWLLIASKFLLSGGSLILSIAAWALVFGLPFAIGFILLIFVHEMGHVIALRMRGIAASVPIFIPFVGAYVAMKEMPRNAKVEAEVALAGPLLGSGGALACYAIGSNSGAPFWYALAASGFFINLFNLVPVIPLDGGRVAAALSPKLWIVGLAAILAFAVWHPGPGLLFLFVLIALSLPRIMHAFRAAPGSAEYYQVPAADRWIIGLQYFGLAVLLLILWANAGAHAGLRTISRGQ